MSCFKRMIRDSLPRSKVHARTTQLQHVYVLNATYKDKPCDLQDPTFELLRKPHKSLQDSEFHQILGVTEIFKRMNVKNILPYFPRLGKDFFHPSYRPILAFGAPTFRAGQGIQKLRQSPTNASNMNDSEPGSKLGGVFSHV